MKKFLSTILAVVMVLSSMAMVVSANEADLADGIYVGTTMYDSIAAAQTAAVASNNEIIISGTVEFGYRQAISADGIHLRGINDAEIIPSASYASGSATNIKGLLNIQADNVRVTDITFDGSAYGDTISQSTDFIVLRINEGTGIELDGVTVKGSPKTLVSIGLKDSTSASVTATNFVAEGELKSITTASTYADIDVVNGSFDFVSGQVDAFISEDSANSYTVTAPGHFTFSASNKRICSSPEHIVNSYNNVSLSISEATYANALANNDDEARSMMTYLYNNRETMSDVVAGMRAMLVDLSGNFWVSSTNKDLITEYIDILDNGITE